MNLAFVYVAKGLEVSFQVVSKVPANATIGWDFGVVGGESSELNPTYTYESPGYYTVTLKVTVPSEEGGEPDVSEVSQTVMVSDAGTKTHLNDSIYNLIDLYVPANLVSDGMSLQEKTTYIQKWQLYLGPLVDHCIPVEEYTNELKYEGLENQLVMELAVWDFLNMQIISLLTGTGQYIDSLTYQSVNTHGEGEDPEEEPVDDEVKAGRVKRIQTGPTEVEYFDELSDSLSTLYKAYSEALKPNGIIDVLRQNLCNLASRLRIFLPMCDNAYKPVKVPRVVNRRHPRGIDGPNPPTILTHR
jgi:PKD repeat protein